MINNFGASFFLRSYSVTVCNEVKDGCKRFSNLPLFIHFTFLLSYLVNSITKFPIWSTILYFFLLFADKILLQK